MICLLLKYGNEKSCPEGRQLFNIVKCLKKIGSPVATNVYIFISLKQTDKTAMKKQLYLSNLMLIICLVCASFTGKAQTFNVSWGDNTKLKYDFDDAVPLADGKTLVLKLEAKRRGVFGGNGTVTPTLLLVDAGMSTIKEQDLEIEESNAELQGFEKYGNNIFFIYNAYSKADKTTSVYALKVNEKTLATSSKITLGTYESDNRGDQAEATYKLSSDSSKVLLFVEGPERRKENKKYYIGVFDTDLKKIWTKDVELPILEKFVSIYDEDITDDGRVFVAIKHYDKEVTRQTVREDGDKVPSYVYKLLVYSKESTKEKEITFDLNKNFIEGTKLIYDKNGTITAAGLYKRKHNGNINGAFYATFDGNSSEVKNPKMVEFPSDMIRLVDKDNFGSDKESDPGLYSNFRINHIMARSNGSVDLIAEYYRLVVTTSYNPQTHTSTTYYNYKYGDIVNTNIDKDGKASFTRIPKNQKYTNANLFLGYYPLVYKDKLILLFNDDKDNVDRDLEKAPDDVMKFKQSVFVAATIDAKGNLKREAIFSNDDEDYITMPRNTTRISETNYLITSDLIKMFKKRTRFGLMIIK
jgi:hypothetical protein